MRQTSSVLVLIALCLSSASTVVCENDYSAVKLIQVSPPTLQAEAMKSDSFYGRPVLQTDSEDLWISGDKNIWRWSISSNSVTRFELPSGVRRPFRILSASRHDVVGFDTERLWTLDYQNKSWQMTDLGLNADCPSTPSAARGWARSDLRLLITKCGVYLLSVQEPKPRFNRFTVPLKDDVLSVAGSFDQSEDDVVIFIQKRGIFRYLLKGKKSAFESVYNSKSNLRGVVAGPSAYYAWTSRAILVFDSNMRRQKVIPVLGQRRLSGFGVAQNIHALLFDDGTLELMSLRSKKRWYSEQVLKPAQYVDFIDDGKYLLASSDEREPQVFRVTTAQ